MVFLYICKACEQGRHEDCEGTRPPMNQAPGEIVFGGSSCKCNCKKKKETSNRKPYDPGYLFLLNE